jgi:hypothetical protein
MFNLRGIFRRSKVYCVYCGAERPAMNVRNRIPCNCSAIGGSPSAVVAPPKSDDIPAQ